MIVTRLFSFIRSCTNSDPIAASDSLSIADDPAAYCTNHCKLKRRVTQLRSSIIEWLLNSASLLFRDHMTYFQSSLKSECYRASCVIRRLLAVDATVQNVAAKHCSFSITHQLSSECCSDGSLCSGWPWCSTPSMGPPPLGQKQA